MNAETRPNLDRRVSTLWPTSSRSGRAGMKHDCGPYGLLTVRAAAAVAGVHPSTIHARVRDGVEGADLVRHRMPGYCQGPGRKPDFDKPVHSSHGQSFALGIMLFRHYGLRPPTAEQLQSYLDCSRAQSYRYVRAYKDALGLP